MKLARNMGKLEDDPEVTRVFDIEEVAQKMGILSNGHRD